MNTGVKSVLAKFRIDEAIWVEWLVERSGFMHACGLIQIYWLVNIHQRNILLDLSLIERLVWNASLDSI